ncbi:MAG TPA: nuclear transport factor 2 family protein [Pyrinomonadaceae bacterium]|nr:nuclear transport factor 2 family protein [Pyrinomonadaceae bacterium]
MKRIILLGALLLAASACSSNTNTPTNTNTSPSPANTNATPTASASPMAEANSPGQALISQEKQIWDMIKAKNPDGFGAMLTDDFIYVSSDGVYDKAGTVNGIKQIEPTEITLSDWKTVMLGKDAGVVTYTVDMKGMSGGKPMPTGAMRAGSVWVNRGGKWVGAFHQETPVEQQPPSNTATTKPTASPAASPAGSPAAAHAAEPVSDDPIAREKQVWDAIKKKDYDRFASFLADDQIEVFAWGVNDKAGSVAGIKQVNLSNAMPGDFKTLKINDDAVVVTYTIKGGGDVSKTGERATTVWVKRDGKWLAVYHQDTTVAKPATPAKK